MWVYRTGKMYQDKPIVLYEYQPSLEMQIIQSIPKGLSGNLCDRRIPGLPYIGKRKTYGLPAAGHMQERRF